jgi:tetratricopeptide (TPR) repeat protein
MDYELQPEVSLENRDAETLSADALLAELAIDLQSVSSSLGLASEGSQATTPVQASDMTNVPASQPGAVIAEPPLQFADANISAGPLSDLFDEFRSAMGETSGREDEDLETQYNLGIAYREMGLLEESISEFQKVAKASEKGQPFRYAMQCCTLLGLAFMEKGQPAIAVIWYQRALQTPGLDQESILALRYDLGMAQELAGDTTAAFNTFSQVYAMSIDYRDVSERIATIAKAR